MDRRKRTVAALLSAAIVIVPGCAEMDQEPVTVLYADHVVSLSDTLADPSDLWVTPEDLTRINGFELKPEGACLDTLCIPVNQTDDSDIVVTRDGRSWFSLTAFARKLNQAYVVDRTSRTWSFSEVPVLRSEFLDNAVAPDFELPDRSGNPVRLSDFRGKKVLLLTWASW